MRSSINLPDIKNRQLLDRALTHRSYFNEHPEVTEHNERLEFLGDAILGFLVGELLYKTYPDLNESQLTRLRSQLVNENQFSKLGAALDLGRLMRLGKGAEKDRGRENPSLLNDTFEAIIGAYYLDSDIDRVREYILPIFQELVAELLLERSGTESSLRARQIDKLTDSKNRFQEWALANHGENPHYVIIKETGPDHAKEFTSQVSVKNIVYGLGTGSRKQEAEKRAAEFALKHLGID
jgi:ribonuclease III